MFKFFKKVIPVFAVVLTLFILDSGLIADTADARSKRGGKSFKSAPQKQQTQSTASVQQKKKGGFASGLAGGLLGGAIGGMLFGSLFGGEGGGMGILPILLFAAGGFFLFRRFARSRQQAAMHQGSSPGSGSVSPLDQRLAEIRRTDPGFDPKGFMDLASDAFFQVQAGWMRRDLDSYGKLLGTQLAAEYESHFAQMREKGIINKLESIAVRKVDIVDAGNTGTEDFITVCFTANLLDYTVDEATGEVVEGNTTQPVKFEENWTFARPMGTHDWKLEGIK